MPDNSGEMSPSQRRSEIATILAQGVLRLCQGGPNSQSDPDKTV